MKRFSIKVSRDDDACALYRNGVFYAAFPASEISDLAEAAKSALSQASAEPVVSEALERILAKYAGAYIEVAAADLRKLFQAPAVSDATFEELLQVVLDAKALSEQASVPYSGKLHKQTEQAVEALRQHVHALQSPRAMTIAVDDGENVKPVSADEVDDLASKLWNVWSNTCSEDASTDSTEMCAELNDGWDLYEAVLVLRAVVTAMQAPSEVPLQAPSQQLTSEGDADWICAQCQKPKWSGLVGVMLPDQSRVCSARCERRWMAEQKEGPEWSQLVALSDIPVVHEAIQNFSHDSTEDNAVCMIRAILTASRLVPVSALTREAVEPARYGNVLADALHEMLPELSQEQAELVEDAERVIRAECSPPQAPTPRALTDEPLVGEQVRSEKACTHLPQTMRRNEICDKPEFSDSGMPLTYCRVCGHPKVCHVHGVQQ